MKAWDLIKAMVYDSDLAEFGGTVMWNAFFTLKDYFGEIRHDGQIEPGQWFYIYEENYSWQTLPTPDVVVETEYAGMVYLWKID